MKWANVLEVVQGDKKMNFAFSNTQKINYRFRLILRKYSAQAFSTDPTLKNT